MVDKSGCRVIVDKNGRAPFCGLASEIHFKQTNPWHDFVKNFMVIIVVLANYFYRVLISSKAAHVYLCPIYWTLVLKGF